MPKRMTPSVSAVIIALCAAGILLLTPLSRAQAPPQYRVDPFWPKPLPHKWIMQQVPTLAVGPDDHVWVFNRSRQIRPDENGASTNPPRTDCCIAGPSILEFDPAGNLVGHWGGPAEGYEWPTSNHGIFIDHKNNVWIGGNGDKDAHVLKFTRNGKLLMQIGRQGKRVGSNDLENFGRVAKIFVDAKTNEAFVADGYGNRRVAVLDADTGKMKRYWGAYGNRPQDGPLAPFNPDAPPSQQFRNPVHCSDVSNDGFVYVCDRQANRLQVFTKDGKFVKEQWYARRSLSEGSVWDVAFSRDPEQRYLFMADGRNQKVRIILRETLEEITNFGDGGRQPGQFFGVHSVATDSKGNLYTTETYEGKRLQKFVYKGMKQVRRAQGVVWPAQ